MPNNNLFNIDIDNIELLLAEANTDLLDKHVNLVNKISKIPSEISNPNEVELVQNLLTEVKSLGKQWSKTRLKDGKPFTDATKIVKNWFGHYEDYLKNKTKNANQLLTDFAISQQEKLREEVLEEHLDEEEYIDEEEHYDEEDHQENLGYLPNSDFKLKDETEAEPVINVPLAWQVKGYNISNLPLEELREYFSDHSIRMALKKHLDNNGPNLLEGVEYEQIAE
jgi:hypothetical protein